MQQGRLMRRGMKTVGRSVLAAALAAVAAGFAGEAVAADYSEMSCSELWYARNAIYAEAGYCFKTDRAISVFGRRCHPPYGDLSGREQRQVEEIKYWESRKGCQD